MRPSPASATQLASRSSGSWPTPADTRRTPRTRVRQRSCVGRPMLREAPSSNGAVVTNGAVVNAGVINGAVLPARAGIAMLTLQLRAALQDAAAAEAEDEQAAADVVA